jgi:polyphosphate kinase
MRYLQSFGQRINENFYYKSNNSIENFFKSWYDLLINLKQMIEGDDHQISYYVNNIKICLTNLSEDILEKLSEKRLIKFQSELENLEKNCNPEVLKMTGLEEMLSKLEDVYDDDLESVKLNLTRILSEYSHSIEDIVDDIVKFCEIKIKKDSEWEIIGGLKFLKSFVPKKEYKSQRYLLQIEFLKLQEWVKKNNKKILIIFDGRDAAGKGANISCISQYLDPKHFRVETFGIPTKEESENWFKRYEKVLPKKGEMVFFDRSWYTRAYVERPMEYCSEKQYQHFLDDTVSFERELKDKNIILVKIWLSIDRGVQKYRFEMRKSNPLKYWKFSENDQNVLHRWDDFTYYINTMLKRTKNTTPWLVIDSNDERKANLESMKSILKLFNYDGKNRDIVKDSDNYIID